MFKKQNLALSLTAAFPLMSFAQMAPFDNFPYPKGYKVIDKAYGVTLFSNYNEDVFIQVADLTQVKFVNKYRQNYGNLFFKHPMSHWLGSWDFSVINGTFFNTSKNPTPLSFPFTPGGNYWGDSNRTRTLCVDRNYNGNRAYIQDTDKRANYSSECTFSLTLIHPDNAISQGTPLGRTYIGISNYKWDRYVLFFVAKKRSHSEMVNIAKAWNVHYTSLMYGDGSASSQYVGHHCSLYGEDINGAQRRNVPHAIATQSRWLVWQKPQA